jgi:hypothetical protein
MKTSNIIIIILFSAVLAASFILADAIYKRMNKNGESLFAFIAGGKDEKKGNAQTDRPLTKAEIEVREALRNTARSSGAAQEMRSKTGGSRGIPVIDVEGIIIKGFSAQAISNAIKQRRKA